MDNSLFDHDLGKLFHLRNAYGSLQICKREVKADSFMDKRSFAVATIILDAVGGLR